MTATYQSREELVGSGLPSSFSVKIKPRPEGRGEVLGETIKLNSAANHIPAKGKFGIFFVSPWGSNSTSAIWRRLQPDLPGRSEAIRRILRAVLKMK